MTLLQKDDRDQAVELCSKSRMPLAKILVVVLKSSGRQRSYLKALAEEVGEREAVALQRYLGLLGLLQTLLPY